MAKASTLNFDVSSFFGNAASQFRGLNPNEPGQWPWLPQDRPPSSPSRRWWCIAGWFVALSTASDTNWKAERNREPTLKADYRNKLGAGRQPGASCASRSCQVQEYVTQLEKQLPGKAEMDALLSDINQAGLGRGLQFELFRPGNGRGQGLLRRAADRDQASVAASMTSARSRPTWPTSRASSRCRT